MKYMGGKFHLAKWIVPILMKQMQLHGCLHFADLFCGAVNIVGNMPATGRRIANDRHADLIALWQAVQTGYTPPLYLVSREACAAKSDTWPGSRPIASIRRIWLLVSRKILRWIRPERSRAGQEINSGQGTAHCRRRIQLPRLPRGRDPEPHADLLRHSLSRHHAVRREIRSRCVLEMGRERFTDEPDRCQRVRPQRRTVSRARQATQHLLHV